MGGVNAHNICAVHERPFFLRQVVVIVPMQGFTEQILRLVNAVQWAGSSFDTDQAMQMVQSFNVRWKSTTILLADLDLIVAQPSLFCFVSRNHDTSI